MQFRQCAILQCSKTPSLRSPEFEDEDDDENETPHEHVRSGATFRAHFLGTTNPGLKPWANIYNRFAVKSDCSFAARSPSPDERGSSLPNRTQMNADSRR